jgi:hypothetical protein
MSSLAVARQRLPTADILLLLVPELSSASATSFSQQRLRTTERQQLCNLVTYQPTDSTQLTDTNCPAYNISARTP